MKAKRALLVKLFCIVAAGTVALFWAIDLLTQKTEQSMSYIAKNYQQELVEYGKKAEHMYRNKGNAALKVWLDNLQAKEQTWAAVVTSTVTPLANGILSKQFVDAHTLGRSVEWKIHLYFNHNPIMDIPFSDNSARLLIRLPQRMRPGTYFAYADLALQVALPFVLLSLLTLVLYQHLMSPLAKLEKATQQFSEGNFDVRINASFGDRNDELTALADNFDHMAERTSKLITNQRQLLSDLSHELRTPLARIDMAIDFVGQGISPEKALTRLRYESSNMRELVEDALTLAWLNTETPKLQYETFDLSELVSVICEDARFEYPDSKVIQTGLEQAVITNSSQRALGQAIENVIRNALHHTPKHKQVNVSLVSQKNVYMLCIQDQGIGVPEDCVEDIFQPFFRVDKSRAVSDDDRPLVLAKGHRGFGLGLALAQRQIEAVRGVIKAQNYYTNTGQIAGLKINIDLPYSDA
jgi:two-component system sensor histidine kinase PfeS